MERASQLKIAAYGLGFAVIVAIVAALFSWSLNLVSAAELACTTKRDAMEMAKSNGCLEFWFNRYQSLVGNVITAAVAGITLIWIVRALGPANRQASAIAAQALKALAGELADQQTRLNVVRKLISDCKIEPFRERPRIWGYVRDLHSTARYGARAAARAILRFDAVQVENGTPPMFRMARQLQVELTNATLAAIEIGNFRTAYGLQDHEPVSDGHADEFMILASDYADAIQAIVSVVDLAHGHLRDEVRLAWREVRELEAKAIGSWWNKRDIRKLMPDRS